VQAFLSQDLFEQEVRDHALAHEAALQVGEHAQDGVDLAGVGEILELLHGQRAGRGCHVRPPFGRGRYRRTVVTGCQTRAAGPLREPAAR